MKRTLPFALAAGLVVASAGIGFAISHGDSSDSDFHHRSPLAAMDRNGDGVVDQQEWNAHFTELDKNGDGKLEADELPGPPHMMMRGDMPPEAVAFFLGHLADTNGDHKVTAAEWQAFIAATDTDRDGALSVAELGAAHETELAKRGGDEHMKHSMTGELPPFAAQWDTDHDGKLSAAELDGLFKAADRNGDGVLDREDHPFHGDDQQRRR